MHPSAYVFLINSQVRAIKCVYEDQEKVKNTVAYTFKSLDKNIKPGDFVIVPTSTRWNMTVVKVTEVDVTPDLDNGVEYKWIIGVANLAEYEHLKKLEEDSLVLIKKKEKLKKIKELREALALDDDDIAALDIAKINTIEPPKA